MTILNLETHSDICSAAIGIDGKVWASRTSEKGANHASVLPVFIESLLAELRQEGKPLDAVAVSGGPGSYTGLRIGVSTAKGICYGSALPLIAIDTTQIIASSILRHLTEPLDNQTLLCPMIDARRMEVYTATYNTRLERLNEIEALVVESDSYHQYPATQRLIFGGDGADKCKEVITRDNILVLEGIRANAEDMCALAEQRLKAINEGNARSEDVAYYTPFYLKEFIAAPSHVKGLK